MFVRESDYIGCALSVLFTSLNLIYSRITGWAVCVWFIRSVHRSHSFGSQTTVYTGCTVCYWFTKKLLISKSNLFRIWLHWSCCMCLIQIIQFQCRSRLFGNIAVCSWFQWKEPEWLVLESDYIGRTVYLWLTKTNLFLRVIH